MIRSTLTCVYQATFYTARLRLVHSSSTATSYNLKYADKLQQKAQEKGLDIEELRSQAREARQQQEVASRLAPSWKANHGLPHAKARLDTLENAEIPSVRKDSSPVKPLSSILNLSRIMGTPHTSSQISALWTAYHASRTKGTGRGYICATLPLESYNAMTRAAKKYPVFVVPVPRESASSPSPGEKGGPAHEFFFLQWDFHPTSPIPTVSESDPFERVTPSSSWSHVPESSTVLFTPLQEYKLRTSFATPYLVLTFYTDLSQLHGIVLLRGEITPSSTSAAIQPETGISERFLLNQVDAQLLAMGLQKFYLWGEGRRNSSHGNLTAEMLLKRFHEQPEKFNWQDLLEVSDVTA